MKNKISLLRIISLFFIILISIFIIVFPIFLRKTIDAKKSASIDKGYRFIELIEKQNAKGINKVNDGENIKLKDIQKSFNKIDGEIDGIITISNGKIIKADLMVDGYSFKYVDRSGTSENNGNHVEIQYYLNSNEKLTEVNSSWSLYIKKIINYKQNYKESAHILSYKYNQRKYSITLDNERECKNVSDKISKIKGYSNLKCTLKYKLITSYEQICNIFTNDKTLCFDLHSWKNIKKIKKQIENELENDIECDLDTNKLYCHGKNNFKLFIKKNEILNISKNDGEDIIRCSLSKNKEAECLIIKE